MNFISPLNANLLLEEAEKRKLVTLERDEKSGGYLIRPAARA